MDFQIITESSGWLVLFCIAAGLLAAVLLYRKNASLSELPSKLVLLLATLRFLSVLLISFLILSPLIRTIFHEVEKPLVIFLQDGSGSVVANADSAQKQQILSANEQLLSGLGDDFEVRSFTIGDRVRDGLDAAFSDKQTDLAAAVSELKSRFAGRNTGAVILSSDGLYNTGANPLYQYDQLNVPVFTIGLGDTTVRKDLLIGGLRYNRTVYKGNTFSVEITVDARRLMGQKAELKILKGEEEVFSKTLSIQSQRFNNLVTAFLDANEKGTVAYTVKLENLSGEVNYTNNVSRFFVDVTENRQKVLILFNSPHPDIALIYEVLESSKTYEVTSKAANEFDGNVSGYNLVILHQIPGSQTPGSSVIESCRNLGLPVWYILGTQTTVSLFNSLKTGITIRDNRGNTGEAQGDPSTDFTAFTFPEEQLRLIPGFPPLMIPFGTYALEGEGQVLLRQKIGQVKTGMPMLAYFQDGTSRSAVLCGEGLWKWGLSEFAASGNKNITSAVILKTVQYLASGRKATPFRVFMKNDYAENEQVTADAELYNPSGELVNDPEVSVTFKHEDGRNFNYVFNRAGKSYNLNAGFLPAGRYRYSASVTLGKTPFNESGGFTVSELLAEQAETVADHQLLRTISSKTGGAFFMPSSMNAIRDSLVKGSIKPVSYERRKLDDLVNLKWYFFLAFLLIALEWLIRKRSGIY